MTEQRLVTIDGWKTALLDEALFRAASQLSDQGSPSGRPTVQTELTLTISVDIDGSLRLRMDSLVDGPVVTTLTPPF